jgi:hypothetical protein
MFDDQVQWVCERATPGAKHSNLWFHRATGTLVVGPGRKRHTVHGILHLLTLFDLKLNATERGAMRERILLDGPKLRGSMNFNPVLFLCLMIRAQPRPGSFAGKEIQSSGDTCSTPGTSECSIESRSAA